MFVFTNTERSQQFAKFGQSMQIYIDTGIKMVGGRFNFVNVVIILFYCQVSANSFYKILFYPLEFRLRIQILCTDSLDNNIMNVN